MATGSWFCIGPVTQLQMSSQKANDKIFNIEHK